MAPTGIAILGSGIFAKEAHLPAIASVGPSIVSLKAIYSRSEKSAAVFAADAREALKLDTAPAVYYDSPANPDATLDSLFARTDVDAVIVVLPITTQPSVIRRALAAGKHVLSEKPVAPDVASGLELIGDYEREWKPKGLVWRVAENHETESAYRLAASKIAEGKIGKVTSFSAKVVNYMDTGSKWYNTPWRTVPDYQGGFLLDGGVHTLAALRVMLPSTIDLVSGFASLNREFLKPEDTIHAVVLTANGAHGVLDLTWGAPTPSASERAAKGITITGTDGWLSAVGIKGGFRVTVVTAKKDAHGNVTGEDEEIIDTPSDGVPNELRYFVNAINGQDDGLGTASGALRDVAFIEAALNSKGAPVDLNKLMKLA